MTDYSRFAVFCSGQANAAGEDIRYLQRDEAEGLPDHDYWLFDSHKLVRMHFDDDDVMLGGEVITLLEAGVGRGLGAQAKSEAAI